MSENININATPDGDFLTGLEGSILKLNEISRLVTQVDAQAKTKHTFGLEVTGVDQTHKAIKDAYTSFKKELDKPLRAEVQVKLDDLSAAKRELGVLEQLREGGTKAQLRRARQEEAAVQRKIKGIQEHRAAEEAAERARQDLMVRNWQMDMERERTLQRIQHQSALARSQLLSQISKRVEESANSNIRNIDREAAALERAARNQARLEAMTTWTPASARSTPAMSASQAASAVAQSASARANSAVGLTIPTRAPETNKNVNNTNAAADAYARYLKNVQAARVGVKELTEEHWSLHSATRGVAASVGGLFLTYGHMASLVPPFAASVAIRESITQFAAFDHAMRSAIAVGQDYSATLGELGKTVQKMAVEFGKAPIEVAKGFQVITAAGYQGAAAASLLREALTLSLAGDVDLERAALSLSGAVDVFNTGVNSASHIGAVFAQVSADSVASIESIMEAMKQASSSLSTYNIKVEEFAVIQEKLAKRNIIGSSAGTSTNNLLMELSAPPSDQAKKALAQLGVSLHDAVTGQRKDLLTQFLPELQRELAKLDAKSYDAVVDKLVNVRSKKAFAALIESDLKDIQQLLEKYKNADLTAVLMSAEKQDSLMGDFNKLKAELANVFIDAGGEGSVELRRALNEIREIVTSPEFKDGITSLTVAFTMFAKVGVQVVSMFSGLTGSADSAVGVMAKLGAAVALAATATMGPAKALSVVLGGIGTVASGRTKVALDSMSQSLRTTQVQTAAASKEALAHAKAMDAAVGGSMSTARAMDSASSKAAALAGGLDGATKAGSGFLRMAAGFARLVGWVGIVISLADAVYYFYKRSKEGKELDQDTENGPAANAMKRVKAIEEDTKNLTGSTVQPGTAVSDLTLRDMQEEQRKVNIFTENISDLERTVAQKRKELFDLGSGGGLEEGRKRKEITDQLNSYSTALRSARGALELANKELKGLSDAAQTEGIARERNKAARDAATKATTPPGAAVPMGQGTGTMSLEDGRAGDTVVTVRNPKPGTVVTIGGGTATSHAGGSIPSTKVSGHDLSKVISVVQTLESGTAARNRDYAGGKLLTSSAGALGRMQVMPATALNPGYGIRPASSIKDPEELARVGREYIAKLLQIFDGDLAKTLAAYNGGAGNVNKAVRRAQKAGSDNWVRFMPKPDESVPYVTRGMAMYRSGGASPASAAVRAAKPTPQFSFNMPSQIEGLRINGGDFDKALSGVVAAYERKGAEYDKAMKLAEDEVETQIKKGVVTRAEGERLKSELATAFTKELQKNDLALATALAGTVQSQAQTDEQRDKLQEEVVKVQERQKKYKVELEAAEFASMPFAKAIEDAQKYIDSMDVIALKTETANEIEQLKLQAKNDVLYLSEREAYITEQTARTNERQLKALKEVENLMRRLRDTGALATEGGKATYEHLQTAFDNLQESSEDAKKAAEAIANDSFSAKKGRELSTKFLDAVFSKDKGRTRAFREYIVDEVFSKPFRMQLQMMLEPVMKRVADYLFPANGGGGMMGGVFKALGFDGGASEIGTKLGGWAGSALDSLQGLFGGNGGMSDAAAGAVEAAGLDTGSSSRLGNWVGSTFFDPIRNTLGGDNGGGFGLSDVTSLMPESWKAQALQFMGISSGGTAATLASGSAYAAPTAAFGGTTTGAALGAGYGAAPGATHGVIGSTAGTATASPMAAAMQSAGLVTAGFMAGMKISGEYSAIGKNPVNAVVGGMAGGAVGAMMGLWGGPIGMAVGAVVGGLINRAFGRGPKRVTGQGVVGSMGEDSSISNYQDWHQKGGWFRSSKSGRDLTGANEGLSKALSEEIIKRNDTMLAYLKEMEIGGMDSVIRGHKQALDIKADEDGNIDNAKIETALETLQEGALKLTNLPLEKYAKGSETLAATLERLSVSTTSASKMLNILGYNLTQFGTGLEGGAMYADIAGAFGGTDNFESAAMAYFEAFYTESEQLAGKKRELERQFTKLNKEVPKSTTEFRLMVQALDLTTAEGRKMYASMLSLAPALSDVLKSQEEYEDELRLLKNTTDTLRNDIQFMSQQMDLVTLTPITELTKAITDATPPTDDLYKSLYKLAGGGETAADITYRLAEATLAEMDASDNLRIGLEALVDPTRNATSEQKELARSFLDAIDPVKNAAGAADKAKTANDSLSKALAGLKIDSDSTTKAQKELAKAHVDGLKPNSDLRIGLEALIDPTKKATDEQKTLARVFLDTQTTLSAAIKDLSSESTQAKTAQDALNLATAGGIKPNSDLRLGLLALVDPTKTATAEQRRMAEAYVALMEPLKATRTLMVSASAAELTSGSTAAANAVNSLRGQIVELNKTPIPSYATQVASIVNLQGQMVTINAQMATGLGNQETLQARLTDLAKQRYDLEAALIKEIQGSLQETFRSARNERVALREAAITILGNQPRSLTAIRADVKSVNASVTKGLTDPVPAALEAVETAAAKLATAQSNVVAANNTLTARTTTLNSLEAQRAEITRQVDAINAGTNVTNAENLASVIAYAKSTNRAIFGETANYGTYSGVFEANDRAAFDALISLTGNSAMRGSNSSMNMTLLNTLKTQSTGITTGESAGLVQLSNLISTLPTLGTAYTQRHNGAEWENPSYSIYAPTYQAKSVIDNFVADMEKVAKLQDDWQTLTNTIVSSGTAKTTAETTAKQRQDALALAEKEYQTAVANLAKARTTLTENIKKFSSDTNTATSRLARLREETVNYYNAQKQLADGLSSSSQSIRDAIQQANFQAKTPKAQLQELQAQFDSAYVQVMMSSIKAEDKVDIGKTIASLIPTILDKAKEVYSSGADYENIRKAILAQASTAATYLESITPKTFQQESLNALQEIDTALQAVEEATKSMESILVGAMQDGTTRTVKGLEGLAKILAGSNKYDASYFTVPQFAKGGTHLGGLRIVGENGPELEATGPSRIWTNDQTRSLLSGNNSNDELIQEVRELKELAARQAELIDALLRHQAAANVKAISAQERTAQATESTSRNMKLEASK